MLKVKLPAPVSVVVVGVIVTFSGKLLSVSGPESTFSVAVVVPAISAVTDSAALP